MKPAELREMSIFIKKTLAEHFERTAAMRVPITLRRLGRAKQCGCAYLRRAT